MANVLAELFQNTANAIREKTGDTGTMKPAEFPDKIRAIETGSGEANLTPLNVTENGSYLPKESIKLGGTYTLKDAFTQGDAGLLYLMAGGTVGATEGGAYAFFDGTNNTAIGVQVVTGNGATFYAIILTNENGDYLYCDEEIAALTGYPEGWVTGIENPTATDAPTFTFSKTGTLYVSDISKLEQFFELKSYDGFSSVDVHVDGSELTSLTVTANGTYYPTSELAYDTAYTLKDDFTQEELQALYALSGDIAESGSNSYAKLYGTETKMLGITIQSAEVDGTTVSAYLPYLEKDVWFNDQRRLFTVFRAKDGTRQRTVQRIPPSMRLRSRSPMTEHPM